MWLPNSTSLGAGNDAALFLQAAWRELFDPFTPDAYQPRLHNVQTLVVELTDIASRACQDSIWTKHVDHIKAELKAGLAEEADLLAQLPEYKWQLQRILKSDSPLRIVTSCKLLNQRRGEYDHVLRQSTLSCRTNILEEKKRIYLGLRRLATLAIHQAQEDDDVLERLPDESSSSDDVFDSILGFAEQSITTYNCVFAVNGRHSDVQSILRKIGFNLIGAHQLDATQVAQIHRANPEAHFVQIDIEARSVRSAVERSQQKLSLGVDLFNLYHNSLAFRVSDFVLVKKSGDQDHTVFDVSEQAFRRLYPRSRASEQSIETLDMIANDRLEDRVLSALELHSLALKSSEPRVRLVNLWSTLECLAGCRHGSSIIERVLSLMTPLLIWRRVDKVVRYTAIAAQQFGLHQGSTNFGSGFPRSNARFVHPWDMMLTLSRPKNHPDIIFLLAFCRPHPLLVFRVNQLWHELHRPQRLRDKLIASENRLRWQICRIYRARNLIVHAGEETPHLRFLLDNLQYYCSVAIQRIIHGMKEDKSWGVLESSEYWNAKSRYIVESLEKTPDLLRVSDFFPLAQLGDAPHPWPRLWPHAPGF
ncbi:hypothetical protein [Roseimaritima ulvae]|uniref:Apea-like HEPN domain-containing protein n=1 Tax=Roseimaritima ulvae TaxID=980254 RepID=A0A5B9QQI2_9BACT|nr:hypothetical protein [Roseimaritima ulvae]QEG41268.1 hypothetical protein UC8_32870 [Roseimaritima ulvae]